MIGIDLISLKSYNFIQSVIFIIETVISRELLEEKKVIF